MYPEVNPSSPGAAPADVDLWRLANLPRPCGVYTVLWYAWASRGIRWDRFARCTGCAINFPAYEIGTDRMIHSEGARKPEPPAVDSGRDLQTSIPMLYCPVCSKRLESRKCKLICEACGYYMSCSDFY